MFLSIWIYIWAGVTIKPSCSCVVTKIFISVNSFIDTEKGTVTISSDASETTRVEGERHGGAELSRRSLRNNIKILWAFFRHAVRQRWLQRDWLEQLAVIELPESEQGPIDVFAGEEMQRLLHTAHAEEPALLPYLAIGGFAGLRTAEMQRLDWGHVDFDQGYIEVTARNAKVRGRRRLVPMPENLKAILLPLAKDTARFCPTPARPISCVAGWHCAPGWCGSRTPCGIRS